MKIPYIDYTLYKDIADSKVLTPLPMDEKVINLATTKRACLCTPFFIGSTIKIHNGKKFVPLSIEERHVHFKLGQLVFTKKTGVSIHNSDHNRRKMAKIRRKITQKKVRKVTSPKVKKKK